MWRKGKLREARVNMESTDKPRQARRVSKVGGRDEGQKGRFGHKVLHTDPYDSLYLVIRHLISYCTIK